MLSLVHLRCSCVKSDRSSGSDQIIRTDGIKHTESLKSKGMKSRSKISSSPLFQRNWAFKLMVWGNSYFASALPFEPATVAARLSHLPSLFVVVLASRLAAGHVGATQPKPAQNYPPEITNWFLPSHCEIVLGRS